MVSTKTSFLILSFAVIGATAQTPVTQSATQQSVTQQASAQQPPEPKFAPLSPEDRGDLYMARRMFREAVAVYKTAPQNSAVIWNKIGIAWHNLGEMSLARKSYEHALKLDKNYVEAINNIGTVYYAEKKYRSAVSRYKRALALAPDKAAFWSNLGTAYFEQRKYPLEMEAYSKAISLDPEIFEHRGTMGTEMQERTVADRARMHFELARLYAKIGKDDLALQYLRHSFEEGFKDKDKVRKSPEFAGMLENPEFIAVMALEPRVL
jgi:tetratricopeptide (TPR) repeat protein